MPTGLILFAHGARDPRWSAPFEAMAAHIRTRDPDRTLRLAYLEFMTPNLADAAAELVAQGCSHIDLMPVFLGVGGHVRSDLPRLLGELQQRHAGVAFTLHPAVGEIGSVVRAMADATLDLLQSNEPPKGQA